MTANCKKFKSILSYHVGFENAIDARWLLPRDIDGRFARVPSA